jgi:hypothetical protein
MTNKNAKLTAWLNCSRIIADEERVDGYISLPGVQKLA